MSDLAELDVLAAKDPHGRLWLCTDMQIWSYATCPLASADGVAFPVEAIPDADVQAALADGSWVPAVLDTSVTPIRILAVQRAAEALTVRTVLEAA